MAGAVFWISRKAGVVLHAGTRLTGYSTSLIGKDHTGHDWRRGPTGLFDRWPTPRGFEYFCGLLGGGTNQWAPGLYLCTEPIEPPHGDPCSVLQHDLPERAIA